MKRIQKKLRSILILAILAGVTALPARAARLQDDQCSMPFLPVGKPLTELGAQPYIRMDGTVTSFTGGLYPDGSNRRPAAHESAGEKIAMQILPLNPAGEPDLENGRIVLISIGMSNTAQEFSQFQSLVHRNPQVNPKLWLVNGAVGGRTAENWVDPENDAWSELQRRLEHDSISNEQVQLAWIKLTRVNGGEFPDKAIGLQEDLEDILRLLKGRFPNLKMAFLSSRTRSYTYWRGLSPEPVAYETSFAVKWLIEKQILGDPSLNYDPIRGEELVPYLSWGPYLWADGTNPRSDGLVWTAGDMTGDCTHPSQTGKEKVANLLFDFFMNDSTTSWFRAAYQPITPTPLPSPSPTSEHQQELATSTENIPILPTIVPPAITTTHSDPTATAINSSQPTQLPTLPPAFLILFLMSSTLVIVYLWRRRSS